MTWLVATGKTALVSGYPGLAPRISLFKIPEAAQFGNGATLYIYVVDVSQPCSILTVKASILQVGSMRIARVDADTVLQNRKGSLTGTTSESIRVIPEGIVTGEIE